MHRPRLKDVREMIITAVCHLSTENEANEEFWQGDTWHKRGALPTCPITGNLVRKSRERIEYTAPDGSEFEILIRRK